MTRWLIPALLGLFVLPAPAPAQEADRMLLEAGIVGGNTNACPGHYLGVAGLIGYRVSAYGLVENYRCDVAPETSSRAGLSLALGRRGWPVRPALRGGLNYGDDGVVTGTVGASLTFGHRYGARFILDRWALPGGEGLVLLQIGGYISF